MKAPTSFRGLCRFCVRAIAPLTVALALLGLTEREAKAVYQYCVTFSPTYIDQGKGEDHLNYSAGQTTGAAKHYYELWNAQVTQRLMYGYLNSSGCTSATTATGTGKFFVFPVVSHGNAPNTMTIRAKLLDEAEPQPSAVFTLSHASSTSSSVVQHFLLLGNFMGDLFRISAVAMGLDPSTLVAGEHYTVVAQADTDVECGGAGGCADGDSTIWLGQETDGTWNNQRKSVIGHELGHLVQGGLFGFPASPSAFGDTDYGDVPNNATFCSCWYVSSPNDRSHCMTSREYLSPAFGEGFAHTIAVKRLNIASEANAIYPYYKEIILKSAAQPSCGSGGSCSMYTTPVAHNVITKHRWLETQCPTDQVAHRATEMDWLGLLYDLNAKNSYSGTDFKSIMLNANVCGAWCTAADDMTWTKLNTSVNAQASFSAAKKALFNTRSVAFGAKR